MEIGKAWWKRKRKPYQIDEASVMREAQNRNTTQFRDSIDVDNAFLNLHCQCPACVEYRALEKARRKSQ